jgi:hypothetical protein
MSSPPSKRPRCAGIFFKTDLLEEHEELYDDIPLVMSISTVGEDLTLGEFAPVIIHNATSANSLEVSTMELIRETEESTHRCGFEDYGRDTDVFNGVNLLVNSYPELHISDIRMILRNLVYRGNIAFLEKSPVNYIRYSKDYVFRFHSMLHRSQEQDLCFKKWLDLMFFNDIQHESLSSRHRNELSALLEYLKRKLDISTPLTTLDIFIIANAYHAELSFYKTFDNVPMSDQLRKFKFVKKCVYNRPVQGKTRVKWIIIQDGTGKFYPVVTQITSKMFYGYRFGKFSTKLIDTETNIIPRTSS